MRHARYSLEEQVGGLVGEERYELRRAPVPEPEDDADVEPSRPAQQPRRPLTIRATRAGAVDTSHAA